MDRKRLSRGLVRERQVPGRIHGELSHGRALERDPANAIVGGICGDRLLPSAPCRVIWLVLVCANSLAEDPSLQVERYEEGRSSQQDLRLPQE